MINVYASNAYWESREGLFIAHIFKMHFREAVINLVLSVVNVKP